jgi:hypothetical protein
MLVLGVRFCTSGLDYKSFTIVIYNCNDSMIIINDCKASGLYYKTMIITNLS